MGILYYNTYVLVIYSSNTFSCIKINLVRILLFLRVLIIDSYFINFIRVYLINIKFFILGNLSRMASYLRRQVSRVFIYCIPIYTGMTFNQLLPIYIEHSPISYQYEL
jgi:hypothetical protein